MDRRSSIVVLVGQGFISTVKFCMILKRVHYNGALVRNIKVIEIIIFCPDVLPAQILC